MDADHAALTEQQHHWLRTVVWVCVASVIAWWLAAAIRESSATEGAKIVVAVDAQGALLTTAVVKAVTSATSEARAQVTKGWATQKAVTGNFFFLCRLSERIITFRKECTCLTP
jgi:hypothetical protein